MTSRTVTFVGFAVITGLILMWAAFSARRANLADAAKSVGAVSPGRAVGTLTRTKGGRVTMFLVWAWLGVHLFARGSGAFKK
jgi:hypothetical protein